MLGEWHKGTPSKVENILAFAAAIFGGFVCGVQSMDFATGRYGDAMFWSYFTHPAIAFLNLLIPILLILLFFALTNRVFVAYLLTDLFIFPFSLVNYYKLYFRGDSLIAEDLSLVSESATMVKTYRLFLDQRILLHLLSILLLTLLMALFVRGRMQRRKVQLSVAALLLCVTTALIPTVYTSDELYRGDLTANYDRINPWSDTENFISKGFVYPFLHSIKAAWHLPPSGYSKKEMGGILGTYEAEDIPAEKRVNLVCLMLEAFNDFSRFEELTFTEDIYEKYHELEQMGVRGDLIVDVFSGDTRISEREFLTGLPYSCMDNFVSPANSYVWYLRSNGYTVEGSHPCYAWFYNRETVNKNLGFENFLFSENYFSELTGVDIVYDMRYFDILQYLYKTRNRTAPYFSFNISYQGHGPYESTVSYYDTYIENKGYSDEAYTVINNYLGSQKGTVEELYKYVTTMLDTPDPLVLVIFGDHKPWLGYNESVYHELGIDLDTSTEDGFSNYYSTRYLILANDRAKAVCGDDFVGEEEAIAVKFLLNKVFAHCGYKGSAYMQVTSDVMAEHPTLHRTSDLSEGMAKLYDQVSYYYRKNFIYAED